MSSKKGQTNTFHSTSAKRKNCHKKGKWKFLLRTEKSWKFIAKLETLKINNEGKLRQRRLKKDGKTTLKLFTNGIINWQTFVSREYIQELIAQKLGKNKKSTSIKYENIRHTELF